MVQQPVDSSANAPMTGDTANLAGLVMTMTAALAAIVVLEKKRRVDR